jgi:hypothetical protein
MKGFGDRRCVHCKKVYVLSEGFKKALDDKYCPFCGEAKLLC